MLNSQKNKKPYLSPARLLPKPNSYDYAGILHQLGLLIGILRDKNLRHFDHLKTYINYEHSPIDDRLIFNYSIFFEAKMLIVFFESMSKEDQQMEIEYQKVLSLRPHITNRTIYIFEELVANFESIETEFIYFELTNKENFGKALNLELKYKISYWQGFLSSAMLQDELNESDPSDYMNSRKDFCHMRTRLEYFRLAIYWIGNLDPKRLEKIPFFGEFEERLEKLDFFLKWKLNKPTRFGSYNDPSFWWSDKTYTFPQNTVAKDSLPGEVSEEPELNIKALESKTKSELCEDVKNLFPIPDGLPGDFFENFNNWAYLYKQQHDF